MKKIVIAILAIFAMTSVASAQTEMSNTMSFNLSEDQIVMINDYLTEGQQNEDIDLTQLKDVSFNTETGKFEIEKKAAGNNPVVGALLAIFLGDFGIHHFYAGDTKHGIWHLLFCWTGIPGIIGFIEGIIWLVDESTYPQPLFGGIL